MIARDTSQFSPREKGKPRGSNPRNLEWIFKCILWSVGVFYLGVYSGWNMQGLETEITTSAGGGTEPSGCPPCECGGSTRNPGVSSLRNQKVNWSVGRVSRKTMTNASDPVPPPPPSEASETSKNKTTTATEMETSAPTTSSTPEPKPAAKKEPQAQTQTQTQTKKPPRRFHADAFTIRHTGEFASGMEFVDRDEFGKVFETGMPFDASQHKNNRAMILYSDPSAFPDQNATAREYPKSGSALSVADATKNCKNLHVVVTSDSRRKQCIGIVGAYEGFHLQKFMRMTDGKRMRDRNTDLSHPFRPVNRGMQLNGELSHNLPEKRHTHKFWKLLTAYLTALPAVLEDLKPIARAVAANNPHETIVVIVCNFGHTEMLLNFVCHARAQGLEGALKNILVFSTDPETHALVTSMGLSSFYSEAVFGETPSEAARDYGDNTYSQIMLSKVYCVHLVSQLGYDLLFQDADVIWYRDPLPWLNGNETTGSSSPLQRDFDLLFQDDGARTLFYAPYSANTGFYFARSNPKTRNFFNAILMNGDAVLTAGSHQSVLISVLGEHASLYNLRVKTWNRETNEFPGGHAYHRRPGFMKELAESRRERVLGGNATEGKGSAGSSGVGVDPYVFHMSWTVSKDNKLKYFEQMGDWYLKDTCNTQQNGKSATVDYTPSSCCSARPFLTCHFRDKASLVPCRDAPASTKEELPSFW